MITVKDLEEQQVGLFATMPNTQAAFEYAQKIAKAEGLDPSLMTTCLMIYHNSLCEQLKAFTGESLA